MQQSQHYYMWDNFADCTYLSERTHTRTYVLNVQQILSWWLFQQDHSNGTLLFLFINCFNFNVCCKCFCTDYIRLALPGVRINQDTVRLFGCVFDQIRRCPDCPDFVRLFKFGRFFMVNKGLLVGTIKNLWCYTKTKKWRISGF